MRRHAETSLRFDSEATFGATCKRHLRAQTLIASARLSPKTVVLLRGVLPV